MRANGLIKTQLYIKQLYNNFGISTVIMLDYHAAIEHCQFPNYLELLNEEPLCVEQSEMLRA